ncbi:MAG TPA: RDD family protein [Verrucomicrobiae bacterium]|nr:RDD family protein [Verrucomicrobiae bacterium]
MNWFYVDAGQQAGPVPDEQLDELVRSGKVRRDTLVWREGLANWQPYAQARPDGLQAPGAPPPPPPMPGAIPPMAAASPQPMYQPTPSAAYGLMYAGFWIRFLAKLIDELIIGVVVGFPLSIFIVRAAMSASNPLQSVISFMLDPKMQLIFTLSIFLYSSLFLGKFGATPGKMALGLRVVTPDGSPIGFGRAFGRSAAEIVSRWICLIGYIIVAFDVQKRGLHDHIANTRVIRTRL